MTMRLISSALGAALVLIGGGTAVAAVPSSPVGEHQLGRCLFERHTSDARHLLNASSAHEADIAYYNLINESSCTRDLRMQELDPYQLSLTMGTLRGIFAEQELRQSRAAAQALPSLTLARQSYVRPWFVGTARAAFVDEAAACVADTDPKGILTLIDTAPGSAAESTALKAIHPHVQGCLPANATLKGSDLQLRSALADALYQRVRNLVLSTAAKPAERG